MKILVVGTGAREHAITRALSLDPAVTELHAAPGNPGIGALATLHAVDQLDGRAVADLARELTADLVVVGPEAPLVAGVADAVRAAGIPVFGPSGEAARLEGSKAFAKEVMAAAGVPTAEPRVATTVEQAVAAIDELGAPHVVKEDGLAAGKGVVVTDDRQAAIEHARACLAKEGGAVVVEEYLDGPEVSLFVLSDGTDVVPLVPAQDFKRALDDDQGPNTGGMGAYTPLPWAPAGLVEEVLETVARPTVAEMARRGTPFVGVLYCGLALTSKGVRVVEFNARFGDPETQVVLARLRTPLAGVLLAAATGALGALPPLEVVRRGRRDGRRRVAGVPGAAADRRRDRGPGGRGRRPARARAARGNRGGRRGSGRQRGRPRAVRDGDRRGPRAGARGGLRGRRADHARRLAAPLRHRAQGRLGLTPPLRRRRLGAAVRLRRAGYRCASSAQMRELGSPDARARARLPSSSDAPAGLVARAGRPAGGRDVTSRSRAVTLGP
ncbi:Phosphoribosylamine--glycine ligase [Cellulomonas persica]